MNIPYILKLQNLDYNYQVFVMKEYYKNELGRNVDKIEKIARRVTWEEEKIISQREDEAIEIYLKKNWNKIINESKNFPLGVRGK